MDRRIYGLETEYGVACTSGGTRRLTPDEVARYLFRRVVTWGRSSNVFLRNGSRIYLDVGSHPEYATAECDDLVQLVNHDRAGERILEGLMIETAVFFPVWSLSCHRTTDEKENQLTPVARCFSR